MEFQCRFPFCKTKIYKKKALFSSSSACRLFWRHDNHSFDWLAKIQNLHFHPEFIHKFTIEWRPASCVWQQASKTTKSTRKKSAKSKLSRHATNWLSCYFFSLLAIRMYNMLFRDFDSNSRERNEMSRRRTSRDENKNRICIYHNRQAQFVVRRVSMTCGYFHCQSEKRVAALSVTRRFISSEKKATREKWRGWWKGQETFNRSSTCEIETLSHMWHRISSHSKSSISIQICYFRDDDLERFKSALNATFHPDSEIETSFTTKLLIKLDIHSPINRELRREESTANEEASKPVQTPSKSSVGSTLFVVFKKENRSVFAPIHARTSACSVLQPPSPVVAGRDMDTELWILSLSFDDKLMKSARHFVVSFVRFVDSFSSSCMYTSICAMQWQSNAAWHRVWLQCQYDELNNNTQAMRGARELKKEKRVKEKREEKSARKYVQIAVFRSSFMVDSLRERNTYPWWWKLPHKCNHVDYGYPFHSNWPVQSEIIVPCAMCWAA